MRLLEERIRRDGIVKEGNILKVDSFLNHQMDMALFQEMAKQWKRDFSDRPINKILAIEVSSIAIAAVVGCVFDARFCSPRRARASTSMGPCIASISTPSRVRPSLR